MKNLISIISIAIALTMLGGGEVTAQDTDPIQVETLPCGTDTEVTCEHFSPTEYHGVTAYREEIQTRFEANPWLTWDNDENGGVFDCDVLLNSITNEFTGITNNNYVILDDRNYYESNPRVENSTSKACDEEFDDVTFETVRTHWFKEYFDYINHPQNDTKRFFLLTPGDYRDYQDLALYNGGTENEKKYILYYDGPKNPSLQEIKDYFTNTLCTDAYHPDNRVNKQAIIERFIINDINSGRPKGNWAISGITIRGNHSSYQGISGGMFSNIKTDGNIIKSCVFENISGLEIGEGHYWGDCDPNRPKTYGTNYLTITTASNNIITDCKFREKNECVPADDPLIDMIGILINGGGGAGVSANNIIFNNDMKDVGDAIHMKPKSFGAASTMGGPGTLIYDNRMYNDKFYNVTQEDGCVLERMNGEGAIDLKVGAGLWGCGTEPLTMEQKVIIASNEIYGWRGGINGGGNGDAIQIHQNAKNIAVLDNHINDCTRGISIGGSITLNDTIHCQISHAEHIEVYNNIICNMYPSRQEYSDYAQRQCYANNNSTGFGIQVGNESTVVTDNIITDCAQGISLSGNGMQAIVTRNYIDGVYKNPLADNRGVEGDLDNFTENTFINFTTVCSGSNDYPNSTVIGANYFLCPDGCRIMENLCPFSEDTSCSE